MRDDRRRSGGFEPRSFAPVKVGDELDVTIEAVGEKGDGVAKKDGFVLFVPGTKQGDTVRIKVTRVLRKVGFAEVVGEAGQAPASEEGQSQEEGSQEEQQEFSEEQSSDDGSGDSEDTEDFGEEESK
ncbi:TRAM domain-containing protein [Candidatus Woesearchaeota archaeon]|nr:TRAM domain-containing protein [Candidatus Woesearchaeota archaeon]